MKTTLLSGLSLLLLIGVALCTPGITASPGAVTHREDYDDRAPDVAGPAAAAAGNDRIPIAPKVEHTRLGNGTGATLTYSLDDDRTVVVELRERLPHRTFLERQGQRRNEPPIVEYFDERCYYQGWIVGRPGSAVALSTCEGRVRGTVLDLDGTYYIDFDEASGGHYVQRLNDPEGAGRAKRSMTPRMITGPFNANRHSKYVELVLVVDNSLYRKFNSDVWEVHRYCTDIVNHVNMVASNLKPRIRQTSESNVLFQLFNQLNIFVALTGIDVWDRYDKIQVSQRADDTLNNFLQYRRKELLRNHRNDHAQLLTAVEFQDHVIGKAKLGGMCTSNSSGAVIVVHTNNIGIQAGTLAHEMGHSFNMEHDVDGECRCPDQKCIMTATVTGRSLKHWSSCSVEQLSLAFSRGLNHCLKDRPDVVYSASCGNGFVEEGEECDCGMEESCDNPCCDAKLCRLKSGAVCATGECCDLTSCQLKQAATVCRAAHSECDLPEYCTGSSEHCPRDVFRRDTESCADGKAYCSNGECRTRDDQCRLLWGPSGKSSDDACYEVNVNGTKYANCGYDRDTHSFRKCAERDVMCGLLFCHQLNDNRLEFGLRVFTEERIGRARKGREMVECHAAFIDLGDAKQPSLVPDGTACGENRMCYQQRCWDVDSLNERGVGTPCEKDCSGHGVCNSEGHCHCDIGYGPPFCEHSGSGGSLDSGPASRGSYLALLITLVIVGVVVTTLFFAYIIIRFCNPDRCRTPLKISGYRSPSSRGSRHKLVATVSSNSAVVRDISAPKLCSSTRDIEGPQFTPIARLKNTHNVASSPPAVVNSVVSVRSVRQPSVGYKTYVAPPVPSSPRRLPKPPYPSSGRYS
ncbi:hypothetical protein pipiens_005739 [Culex pipiens pipiens]|uniref:Uncharacterized protein n=1 Tax=Culex pipiens pipiens TaxID=38569 RepID=A0ABD1DYA6_CULPP